MISEQNLQAKLPQLRRYAVAIGLLFLMTAAFALGQLTAPVQAQVVMASQTELQDLRANLELQRIELAASRERNRRSYLSTSKELGLLQARLDRIDALGAKLTEVALLSPELFDFDAEPPRGGLEDASSAEEALLGYLDGLEHQLELRERQLDILEHLLMVSQLKAEHSPSGWPVDNSWISSSFGTRTDPFTGRKSAHYGMDFAALEGTAITAVAGGVVSFAGVRSGFGNVVEVNHGNGYVTRYAHNRSNFVKVGDRVAKGQKLAEVGRSGRATGPHLHLEVMLDGRRVNPAQFIVRK